MAQTLIRILWYTLSRLYSCVILLFFLNFFLILYEFHIMCPNHTHFPSLCICPTPLQPPSHKKTKQNENKQKSKQIKKNLAMGAVTCHSVSTIYQDAALSDRMGMDFAMTSCGSTGYSYQAVPHYHLLYSSIVLGFFCTVPEGIYASIPKVLVFSRFLLSFCPGWSLLVNQVMNRLLSEPPFREAWQSCSCPPVLPSGQPSTYGIELYPPFPQQLP